MLGREEEALGFKSNFLAMQGLRHSYSAQRLGIALTLMDVACNSYTTVAMTSCHTFRHFSQLRGAPDAPHAHADRVKDLLRRGFAAILRGWGDIVEEMTEWYCNENRGLLT